jgi:branched-chain amino acid transport system permease protein
MFGLAMRALIEHREAAAVVGVDVDRVQLASFVLGFGTAAIAGTLLSMTEQVSPFMGFPITVAAFVVVIMGGLGRLEGGVAAALLLGLIETYGVALTSPTYRSILVYGAFVLVLVARPHGLLGRRAIVR